MIVETYFLAEEPTAMRTNLFQDLFFYQSLCPDVVGDAPGTGHQVVKLTGIAFEMMDFALIDRYLGFDFHREIQR